MVNYGYFETHDYPSQVKRKRKRANELDPNASKADKRYSETYGL